jgi:nucleoside-diphosphate-sugar epimerase
VSSPAAAPAPAVRSRRTRKPVVAVTGAASGLGQAVASSLAQRPDVGKVVAIDDRRGDVEGVTWRVLDVCDPALAGRLGKVDAIVHLDVDTSVDSRKDERPGRNVRGTQTVITAAAATGVRRVVLVTSAMVYGALPDNPVPLDEDAPLRALPDGSFVSDLLEIEQLAHRAPLSHRQHPDPAFRGAAAAGRA